METLFQNLKTNIGCITFKNIKFEKIEEDDYDLKIDKSYVYCDTVQLIKILKGNLSFDELEELKIIISCRLLEEL